MVNTTATTAATSAGNAAPIAAAGPSPEPGVGDAQRHACTSQQRRFDALYDAHAESVYRFCLRLSGGRIPDAEDLTQEVLLAAYEGLPRFAGRSGVRTWLYRIAVYRWRSLRDAHARTNAGASAGTAMNGEGYERAAAPVPDTTAATVARLSLEAALAALPDPFREAFLLVKAEGLTHREAARVLEIPQGTVQSRVHEAIKRLRVLLAVDDVGFGQATKTGEDPEGDKR